MFIEYLQCTRLSPLPNHSLFSICVSGSFLLPSHPSPWAAISPILLPEVPPQLLVSLFSKAEQFNSATAHLCPSLNHASVGGCLQKGDACSSNKCHSVVRGVCRLRNCKRKHNYFCQKRTTFKVPINIYTVKCI